MAIFSIQIKMFSLVFSIPPLLKTLHTARQAPTSYWNVGALNNGTVNSPPPIISSARIEAQKWSFIQKYSSCGAAATNTSALSPARERVADYEPFANELEGDTTE